MEFIIISGISTILSSLLASKIISDAAKKRGYVSLKYEKKQNLFKRIVGFGINFVPIVNHIIIIINIGATIYFIKSDEKTKNKYFNFANSIQKPIDAKELIEYQKKSNDMSEIKDSMRLEGATDKDINKEIKKIPEYNYTNINNRKYKEIQAMTDTELWLNSIYMDVGLSYEEKKELFSYYVDEFKSNNAPKKSKALEKTMEIINKR